jgi:hypothetical protein
LASSATAEDTARPHEGAGTPRRDRLTVRMEESGP